MALLWYASYGSNMDKDRFLCYIQGGRPEGSQTNYRGCSDKTPPRINRKVEINQELYFARRSNSWTGGGVCFLKNETHAPAATLGKMYLITYEQFTDVMKQECDYEGRIHIDFQEVREKGSRVLQPDTWYGKLIFLGSKDGYPIFTFTNSVNLTGEINPPNEHYVRTIARGLSSTYEMDSCTVTDYLKKKEGIRGYEIQDRLTEIIDRPQNLSQ